MTKVKLPNKTCKGIYIISDEIAAKEIIKAPKLKEPYRLVLRVKVNGKQGKRVYPFEPSTTLTKAIDIVNAKRYELTQEIETLERGKTLRSKKPEAVKVLTFKEAWDEYIEQKVARGTIRTSTLEQYTSIFNLRFVDLYKKPITEITKEDLEAVIDKAYKDAKKMSPATIRLMLAMVKPLLKGLDFSEIVPVVKNRRDFKWPMKDVKLIVKAMRDYYEPETRGIFLFLLSGRRIGEVLGMKHEHINGSTWTIPNSKSGEELVFHLDDEMLQILRERKGGSYVFKLGRLSVRKKFYKLLEDLKLPNIHLHDIRSLVATTLFQNGVAIQDIAQVLGHSSVQTTISRYVTSSTKQATTAQNTFKALIDD